MFSLYREDSERHLALERSVTRMLGKGAIEPVLDPQAGFFSHVFLVPKVTVGGRLFYDLLILYHFLVVTTSA